MGTDPSTGAGRSPFGASERATLARLADEITAANATAMNVLGPRVADTLRLALPDVDDVAIGRVLVAVANELGYLFLPGAAVPWSALAAAGLHLTEPEWKTP